MSITAAAEDLCLTQSAVSRQIQALEEALGVKLFNRGHRSIRFTQAGERLFRIADDAVQQLQEVFGTLNVAKERLPVTITAAIGVTALWLLPRLGRFQVQHPNIDVRVAANNKLLDLHSEDIDLAIRYCNERNAPPASVRLFSETPLVPVAHPSLAGRRLDSAEEIAQHVLIEFDDPQVPWLRWTEWLRDRGLDAAKPKATLRFNQYDQVIQAAAAGQGIALGRLALVQSMLADKRLTILGSSEHGGSSDYAYWLIQAEKEAREDVRRVAEWITSEAQHGDPMPISIGK